MSDEKSLAVKEQYVALARPVEELALIMEENLDGDELNAFDLDKVGMPTGGGVKWKVPSVDGDPAEEKELVGIILYKRPVRAYWPGEFSGSTPPACVSEDSKTGVGDPGGNCKECPYAKFGSGMKERGQACKQIYRVFLLRPGHLLPVMIPLPPTSIRAAKQYFLRLFDQQIPYYGVVTKVTLQETKNADGIKYATAEFARVETLDEENAKALAAFRSQLMESMRTVPVTSEDYVVEGGE